MNEKFEFSTRLRASMVEAGYQARPTVLEREFNLRWHGRSISMQAAWGWLNNKALPTQDKIQVLAEWLRLEPEVLRFGNAVRIAVKRHREHWSENVGNMEQETFEAFLKLPVPQRKIVREVILAFAKAQQVP